MIPALSLALTRPAPGLSRLVPMIIAAIFHASGAGAQIVDVRSGEHPGFSRLVLDIGADRDWTLAGSGRTQVLTLDPPVAGFSTATVFDLIPRDRLAGLEAGETLTLSLACDCAVTAERYRDRYLILDIAVSETVAAPPADPPPPTPEPATAQAASAGLPDLTELLTAAPPFPRPPRPAGAPPQDPAPPPVDMAEAARLMSEQLARAAASGLLLAAPGRPLSDADPSDPPPAPEAAAPSPSAPTPPQEVTPRPDPGLPLRAATALDLVRVAPGLEALTGPALACPGDPLPLRDWSRGLGLAHDLGLLRQGVFDARDRLDPEGVLTLARHYLYHGFGAEAAHWLTQLEDPPLDLLAIAAIVDDTEGPAFQPAADPLGCSDDHLLWRYLGDALGDLAPSDELADRVQRAAAALPAILRDQIAPRVARRLLADGFPGQARNLRDMLERGGRLPDVQMLALDLDLGFAAGGDPDVTTAIDRALRDDAADPAGLMAQALRFGRETGAPADPLRLDAAEALLRENGIAASTAALWSEVLLARAAEGRIDRALSLLSAAGALPHPARQEALTSLVADRVAAGDSAALLVLARSHGAQWQATGSEAGRARVAAMAQLRALGLTEAAGALAAGQPMLILPARPADRPEPQEALQTAWVLGEWSRVAEQAQAPHAALARRLQDAEAPTVLAPDAPPDLSRLVARLADSRALRDEIAALLASPDPRVAP